MVFFRDKSKSRLLGATRTGISPSLRPGAASGLFGKLEAVDAEGIRGWFYDAAQPSMPLVVKAHLEDKPIGTAECEMPRKDIREKLRQEIDCGFVIHWDWELVSSLIGRLPADGEVAVRVTDVEGRTLPGEAGQISIASLRSWAQEGLAAKRRTRKTSASELARYIKEMEGPKIEPVSHVGDVKVIAFYLPQYHPIPENDAWWGPGFSEWTNVSQSKPCFDGHYQPHIPGELGFYDLRLPEVREAQADLARQHGIHGFCYYYYWFAGRRLLERPLQEVLESGKPDFPFCICWANETWSRRWDGSEHEVLLQQVHDTSTDEAFIRDVIPIMKDPRYIRVKGAPLLMVYRLSLMPEPTATAAAWRRICAEEGIEQIHLCMAETFGLNDPFIYGFDSAVQFPPHGIHADEVNHKLENLCEGYEGKVYSMKDVVGRQMVYEPPVYKRFPGIMTSWDNTARKKKAAHVFVDSSPELFELWLRHAVNTACKHLPEQERFVFVNAWNEWAEGAHLEPDRKYGRAYLEAVRRVVTAQHDWRRMLQEPGLVEGLSQEDKDCLLHELSQHAQRVDIVNTYAMNIIGDSGLPKQWARAKLGVPFWLEGIPTEKRGKCFLEQVNYNQKPRKSIVGIDAFSKIYLRGWSHCPSVVLNTDTLSYLLLQNKDNAELSYYVPIFQRLSREDVANAFPKQPKDQTLYSGFKFAADLSIVKPGSYSLCVAYRDSGKAFLAYSETEFEIC